VVFGVDFGDCLGRLAPPPAHLLELKREVCWPLTNDGLRFPVVTCFSEPASCSTLGARGIVSNGSAIPGRPTKAGDSDLVCVGGAIMIFTTEKEQHNSRSKTRDLARTSPGHSDPRKGAFALRRWVESPAPLGPGTAK